MALAGLILPKQEAPLAETVADKLVTTKDFYLWFAAINSGVQGAIPSMGTRAERDPANSAYQSPANVPEGALYYETDTGLFYQSRRTTATQPLAYWAYVLGAMEGTLADRPTGLTANDEGLTYEASDAGISRWSGTAWVSIGGSSVGGAAGLTDPGRLTMVGAPGTLAESTLTDNGTKVSGTRPLYLDIGATPADVQLEVQAKGLGGFSVLCYAADNVKLMFDVAWAAGAFVARNASVALILKNGAQLRFYGSTGNAVGGVPTLTVLATLDLATGHFGFGGNAAPGYAVDATGDVNASGVLRVGGTQVVGAQQAAVTAASGGSVIDVQARAAINALIARLSAGSGGHGLIG